jgi:hypothetical protein
MAKKKPPKVVTLSSSGAWLWGAPEPIVIVPPRVPSTLFAQPSAARRAQLQRKYAVYRAWHKQLLHDNAAGRFVASLGRDEEENDFDSPSG